MMTIANPIYDSVFKYLMEDERIARTILSALLKEDIVKVEVRPHEYINGQKESLSIFRIDFGATIRKADGSEQLILIELQKTWLPTEILRFRQYIGIQYQNANNIVAESRDRHALPMVAVYLLGHTVGDIEEPVVYVRHEAFDYDNQRVTQGIPNQFVESLHHDSIFVQIPRLHGKINNRLDKVLSIFDQKNVYPDNQHWLSIDENAPINTDADMQPIIHRLLMAATNTEMRQNMNVEDEYFSIIKEQEGKVFGLEKELAETTSELEKKKEKIAEMGGQIAEMGGQIAEMGGQIAEMDGQIAEMDGQIAEMDGQIAEMGGQIAEMGGQIAEKDGQIAEMGGQLHALVTLLLQSGQTIKTIAESLHLDEEVVKALLK